jgi:hypothetical protein
MADTEVLQIEVRGQHLASSSVTPGFFVPGSSREDALRRYVEVLKALGPMPMLATRQPAVQPARPAGTKALRALYLGFAFDSNFGDRWMYRVLEARLPQVQLVHPRTAADHWQRVLPKGHFDLLFLGAGTLINQQPLIYEQARPFVEAQLPCVCFGTGVGEERRWGDHLAPWAELLSRFAFVGVRGPRSKARLAQAGLTNHRVVGDPCLLDEPDFGGEARAKVPRIFVDLSYGADEKAPALEFRYRLLKALDELEARGAAQLTFFSTWDAYDRWVSQQLALCMSKPHPVTPLTEKNRHLLKEASLCITYRLHAGAAALRCGVPTALIEYEDKVGDFAEFLGLSSWLFSPDPEGAGRLERLLTEDLPGALDAGRPVVRKAMLDARAAVEGHLADFQKLLSGLVAI